MAVPRGTTLMRSIQDQRMKRSRPWDLLHDQNGLLPCCCSINDRLMISRIVPTVKCASHVDGVIVVVSTLSSAVRSAFRVPHWWPATFPEPAYATSAFHGKSETGWLNGFWFFRGNQNRFLEIFTMVDCTS